MKAESRKKKPRVASVPSVASVAPLTAGLRAAHAFDTALAFVLEGKRMDREERSVMIIGPSDDDRLIGLSGRLTQIGGDVSGTYWADDETTRSQVCANLQFDLGNVAAYALIWATAGQRNYTRGCAAIAAERQRQRELLAAGRIKEDMASPTTDPRAKFRVLFEECGEVAHAIDQVKHHGLAASNIHAELIQVATVCVAWLEAMPRQNEELRMKNGGGR
jgi:NTP pyrophosphatase (non-canonical NTP hydrolase)